MTDLTQLINTSGYDIFFLVVDKYLNFNIDIGLKYFYPIFFPELNLQNSGQLLAHPQTQDYVNKISGQNGHKVAILSFKPSAKIEHLCRKNNWKYLNNSSSLSRLYEDKIKFYEICKKNNIPTLPSTIAPFNQSNFTQFQRQWGSRLVLQTHFGWAGNSTFSADKWSDVSDKISQNTIVKYSPFTQGSTLLNNCCLTHLGLLQSPPANQLTGLPQYTLNPFSTVGRQWPTTASPKIVKQIQNISLNFSKILSQSLYKGFFGLDFLADEKENVYLLECNPRLTASFAFYTLLELKNNITPLLLFHLVEFLDLNYQLDLEKEQARFKNKNIIGSQTTPRLNPQNRITKVVETFE